MRGAAMVPIGPLPMNGQAMSGREDGGELDPSLSTLLFAKSRQVKPGLSSQAPSGEGQSL